MNKDGSNPTMLTDPRNTLGCDCYDETPAYTPDGAKIVFSRDDWTTTPEVENIFIMNADGTNLAQLTNNTAVNFDPLAINVAGAGSKILFSSNVSNPTEATGAAFDLYSMNLDGTSVARLSTNTLYDSFSGEWYEYGELAALRTSRHSAHHRVPPTPKAGHPIHW